MVLLQGITGDVSVRVKQAIGAFLCLLLLVISQISIAQEIVITQATTVGSTDTSLDGQDVVVNGTTLTISGTHSFTSLRIIGGGRLTYPVGTALPLVIQAGVVEVDATSSISVLSRGQLPSSTVTGYSGGSYGGRGGIYNSSSYTTNPTYGDYQHPVDLGTGGNSAYGSSYDTRGGGALKLVADELVLEGRINANGSYNYRSGGGSGGSLWLDVGVLRGTGVISANGGAAGSYHGANSGGGGGRIAIYYSDASGFDLSGKVQAYGGVDTSSSYKQPGGVGSIYLKTKGETAGELRFVSSSYDSSAAYSDLNSVDTDHVVVDKSRLIIGDGVSLASLSNDGGRVFVGTSLTVSGELALANGGWLFSKLQGTTAITAGTISVDATSSISASGRGLLPSSSVGTYSGGSHGGRGGVYSSYTTNPTYGDYQQPTDLGTGGAGTSGNSTRGGGALKLVADELVLEGRISANGSGLYRSGGGSGGSLWLDVGVLRGAGVISANGGGAGGYYDANSGGGGGRIAIYYSDASGFDLSGKVQAYGGVDTSSSYKQPGGVGSIYLKTKGETAGALRFVSSSYDSSAAYSDLNSVDTDHVVVDKSRLIIGDGVSLASLSNDGGRVFVGTSLTVSGELALANGGWIFSKLQGTTAITAGTISVDATSSISASGRGLLPSSSVTGYSGGSYGGRGGVYGSYSTNPTYGDYQHPVDLGTGGNSAYGSSYDTRGGGALKLVADELVLEGSISANGSGLYRSGGGSGGSLWLDVGVLRGAGVISANGGGAGGYYDANSGGGGGRIAIYYSDASGFDLSGKVQAYGGVDTSSSYKQPGEKGTIYLGEKNESPYILSATPGGFANTPIDKIQLHFNTEIDLSTLGGDNITISDTAGNTFAFQVQRLSTIDYSLLLEPALSDGEYEVTIGSGVLGVNGLAIDQDRDRIAGEVPDDSYTFSFTVDTQPPERPTVGNFEVAPKTNLVATRSVVVEGTRPADASIWINSVRKLATGSDDWQVTVPRAEGVSSIEVQAGDAAGNLSEPVTVNFLVDTIAPVISSFTPSANQFLPVAPGEIRIAYTETGSGIDFDNSSLQISANGNAIAGNWQSVEGAFAFTPILSLLDANYRIDAILKDLAGNTFAAAASIFTVDTQPPAVPVISDLPELTIINTITLSGSKEAYSAVWMNGTEIVANSAATTWSYTATLTTGLNDLNFKARDLAGNESTEVLHSIRYDNTAPGAVSITTSNVGDGTSVEFAWPDYDEYAEGNDIDHYDIYIATTAFDQVGGITASGTVAGGTRQYKATGLLRDQLYYFAVVAVDSNGNSLPNVSPLSLTTVDEQAPDEVTELRAESFADQLVVSWQASADKAGDLAGYRLYVDGDLTAEIPVGTLGYTVTGLAPATGYQLVVKSIDGSANESSGITLSAATLMPNPSGLVSEPHSGKVDLIWQAVIPAEYVKSYAVYAAETDFNSVEGMTPRLVVDGSKITTGLAGLTDDVQVFIAVTTINISGGETKAVNTITETPHPDRVGPTITGVNFGGVSLENGAILSHSGDLTLSANDPAGIGRVEFMLAGQRVATDTNGSDGYGFSVDLLALEDGPLVIEATAYDTLDNATSVSRNVTVALAPPAAPVLSAPKDASVTNESQITITGKAEKNSQITLYHNGTAAGETTADDIGDFSLLLTLGEGDNTLSATATNRGGIGAKSTAITVSLDTSIPEAPTGLGTSSGEQGVIKLSWNRTQDLRVVGYDLYRSSSAFDDVVQAEKVNTSSITSNYYQDMPIPDGEYTYRLIARNALGTASTLSNMASGTADSVAPRATAIEYAPEGLVDPITGRVAPGQVGITLQVSEPLLTTPFLSISPDGGVPMLVQLTQQGEQTYTGSITITETTKSGTAYAVFSARDMVGNRGTEVDSGATLEIDTAGPTVTQLAVVPTSPVKNDSSAPANMTVEITLDQALKSGTSPQLAYKLSGAGRLDSAVELTAINETVWRGSFILPTDGGAAGVETLSFSFEAQDDLDNIGRVISATNSFEVYQGELPPLAAPGNLSASVQSGGTIKLTWDGVEEAVDYQLYRKGPGEAQITPLDRTTTASYEETVAEGEYSYSVASIRKENDQEALSDHSNIVTVTVDTTAPPAPQGLNLELVSSGIQAIWQAPNGLSEEVTYNVYRAGGTTLTSIDGLTPVQTNIGANSQGVLAYIDGIPDENQSTYAVTAVDKAGNESAPSESQHFIPVLMPVSSLSVSVDGDNYPVVKWTHSGKNLAGYRLYIDGASTPLSNLMTATSYTDTGYTGDERSYTVTAVDIYDTESIGRTVKLANLELILPEQSTVKRGIFNQLDYTVTNHSSSNLSGIRVSATLAGHYHASNPIYLAAGESATVPVVVGGFADLPGVAELKTTLSATSTTGESVSRGYSRELVISDSTLVMTVETQELTRGTEGKLRFTLQNPSSVETEIVTALSDGAEPSNEVRIHLLDADGNVLLAQPFKQVSGANVAALSYGKRVARIPAGGSFTSDWISMQLPTNMPDNISVEVVIDHFHYHTGRGEHVAISGMTGNGSASLVDTAYSATVDKITPTQSFGGEPFVITGQAISRVDSTAQANVPVKLVIVSNGFERSYTPTTDATGNYSYTFTPLYGESGRFVVSAIHPDTLARPGQGSFVITRFTLIPDDYSVKQPYNVEQTYDRAKVSTGSGTSASGLRLELIDAQLPTGITLKLPEPFNLGSGRSAYLPFSLLGDNNAAATGTINLKLVSDTTGDRVLDTLRINYTLAAANPVLKFSPTMVEAGVQHDGTVSRGVTLENSGLGPMNDVEVKLLAEDGTAAPDWIYLTSNSQQGQLDVGEKSIINFVAAPTASVSEGVYAFKLRVSSSNYQVTFINIYVTVTQSGAGSVLFKVSDIYTATLDASGKPIMGVEGANVRVQNEEIYTIERSLTTDAYGEAMFKDLPAGRYRFRASAGDHEETLGRFTIMPGITESQDVFLNFNLITVEWSVTEITLQDTYEITLQTTFETDVPAAVVVTEPSSATLPDMKPGEVFNGSIRLTNYGLVRADNLQFALPGADAYFRFEFLEGLPTSLAAKESIIVPYRVVALSSLDPDGTASGGGCTSSYGNSTRISYSYPCANGATTTGEAQFSWFRPAVGCDVSPVSSAPGSPTTSISGAIGFSGGGGFGGGGGSTSSTSTPSTSMGDNSCPVPCPTGTCASGRGSDGGGE